MSGKFCRGETLVEGTRFAVQGNRAHSTSNTATWALSDAELSQLDEVTEPRILYPYWHQQFSARPGPADQWP